jgi:hypothetical protein
MNFTFSPALRAKLYDEDKVLMEEQYRNRWLKETAQCKKANADMVNIFYNNKMPEIKKKSLLSKLRP